MIREVIILGTGGNCVDILDVLDNINQAHDQIHYKCVGYLDDAEHLHGKRVQGIEVLGGLEIAPEFPDCKLINGIGSEKNFWFRDRIVKKTGVEQEEFETIVDPSSQISGSAKIGPGSIIFQNVTISSNVVIGSHVMILPNSTINHDSVIGDFSCLASGVCISGNVISGKACYFGTNSSIKNDLVLDNEILIGMGSVVLENVSANSVVAGNPARLLRKVH